MYERAPDPPALVPLSWKKHGRLRLIEEAKGRFDHVAGTPAVAVCLAELDHAGHEFPLAFMPQPDGSVPLIAILGPPAFNLFVEQDGSWSGRYAPAAVRMHPFGWLPDGNGRTILGIDDRSPCLSLEVGAPLFREDGSPTVLLRHATDFAARLAQQLAETEKAAQALLLCGVLESWHLPLPGVASSPSGLLRVSEARLRDLAPNALRDLMDQGALALAYAQLNSTTLIERLEERSAQRALATGDRSAAGRLGA